MDLKQNKPKLIPKLFVLDTNVLFHDPKSLFKFMDNDIYLSIHTLEDLDNNKKGMSETSRNAREASRILDNLIRQYSGKLENGIPLKDKSENALLAGRLFLQREPIGQSFTNTIPLERESNQVIFLVKYLAENHSERTVVLVTKDINMRIKAKVLGINTQDYVNDKVLNSFERLSSGIRELPPNFKVNHQDRLEKSRKDGFIYYNLKNINNRYEYLPNQFLCDETEHALSFQVQSISKDNVVLRSIQNYLDPKSSVWGIHAKNKEQNFALNLLMDPDIHLVSLVGAAGTGKTLLALAAGLVQTMETKAFSEIIITRNTIPIGEDIGFLPGSEEEKMNPWMGAIEDNLEVLNNTTQASGKWGRAATHDFLFSKVSIKSLNFMRGRTFTNKFLIIDEAQNLSPQQMKTLITRAGQGTKVICLGNTLQIDSPFLTEDSSGLTYVVDKFKNWKGAGHIRLTQGERSELADFAIHNL